MKATLQSSTQATAQRTKRSAARVAFLVHSAAGLWLTILLSIVMVSGTIAMFAPELDRLIFSNLHSSPISPDATKVNPGIIYDAVARAYPGMGITHIDTAAHDKYASATTTIQLPGKAQKTLAINAYTGEILGDVPYLTLRVLLVRIHATLFQGLPGFYVVNFCGIVVLALIISGLIAYKRFWRGLFKRVRTGFGWRITVGDLHRLVAVWSLPFLLVIGITGTWYFYNFPLAHIGLVPEVVPPQPPPPMMTSAELDALGPKTPTRLSGTEIAERVQAAYPDMTFTGLMPPINLNMPFVIYGDSGQYLRGKDSDAVYVNPYNGNIMGTHLAKDTPFNKVLFKALSKLHHGELVPPDWGYPALMTMKTIWFLFGVAASFLTISGLLLYYKRTRDALPLLSWKRVWRWIRPWGGPMKIFKYINVLVLLALIVGIGSPLIMGHKKTPPGKVAYADQSAGDFTVSLTVATAPRTAATDPRQPGSRVMVFPHIANDRFKDARTILVGLTKAKGASARGVRVRGAEKLAFASVRLPKQLDGVKLWIQIRQWDGSTSQVEWPLDSGMPVPSS